MVLNTQNKRDKKECSESFSNKHSWKCCSWARLQDSYVLFNWNI